MKNIFPEDDMSFLDNSAVGIVVKNCNFSSFTEM